MKGAKSDERVVILAVFTAAICCGLGPFLLGALGLGALGLARTMGLGLALVAIALAVAAWALHRRPPSRRDRR